MKQKTLLFLALLPMLSTVNAQKKQKQKQSTAFAITGVQKGQSNWTEVRLVDVATGEEVKSIYQSAQTIEVLNARTGKPIVKKEAPQTAEPQVRKITVSNLTPSATATEPQQQKVRTVVINRTSVDPSKPFATTSAACAYDAKHERLYYTPMGISQLRYIDLKSKTPKVYYFEDEAFGVLSHARDVPNQITRMVIASDGNGYALTNNAEHLIRFTTGKKPVITDLGPLTDDPSNEITSVQSKSGYGGDMVADAQGNLYLITSNKNVFKISIETKVAVHLGRIKGLPAGFSTNGAIVDEDSKVIVSSSSSTQGYYKFDLTTLESEKANSSASVFNASDLANGNLAFEKKKKKREEPQPVVEEVVKGKEPVVPDTEKKLPKPGTASISVFPNPVTNGQFKLSFNDQPAGKYSIQLMDVAGKIISRREVTINNKLQVEEFRLPEVLTAGSYLVKVESLTGNFSVTNKLFVQ
jgi:hypothetical protein